MKDSLRYLKLWQKKRNEMQVNDDPQADWLQMQSLLDIQMPVVKKSSGFKRLKMLPTMFIAFSAAAMVYMVSNIISLEKHKHPVKHSQHHKGSFHQGSIFPDSLALADSSDNNVSTQAKDSALLTNQGLPVQGNGPGTPALSKTTINGPIVSNNHRVNDLLTSAKHVVGAATGQIQGSSGGATANWGASPVNSSSLSNRYLARNGHLAGRNIRSRGLNTGTHYVTQINLPNSNHINKGNNFISPDIIAGIGNHPGGVDMLLMIAATPQLKFGQLSTVQPVTLPALHNSLRSNTSQGQAKTDKTKKDKAVKTKNSNPSNIDWGILTGVNSSGSFTPKSQNANFYGSSPVDLYAGLFASYELNDKWAINPQIRLFSPQSISTTYTHANQSKIDSNQNLKITASRKVYAVSVPIYAVYNVTSKISFKAGPVINFPVKQINTNSLLQPAGIKADSTYYTKIAGILDSTKYAQKLNFGISAGASIKYKRLIFEATYLKSLSGYGVTSGLGSYKSYNGTFQFTIGFQLDKVKP